jgi:hypothetical protein
VVVLSTSKHIRFSKILIGKPWKLGKWCDFLLLLFI